MRRRISGCSHVSSMKIGRGGGPDALSGAPTADELRVAEVVDEPNPQGVEQQPVSLGAFAEASGGWIRNQRARVSRGRLAKVGLFQLPGPWPGRLEFNL